MVINAALGQVEVVGLSSVDALYTDNWCSLSLLSICGSVFYLFIFTVYILFGMSVVRVWMINAEAVSGSGGLFPRT